MEVEMGGTDFFDEDLVHRRGAVKSTTLGGTEVVGTLKSDELPAHPISDLNLTRMARHREEVNTQVASAKLEIERMRRRQGEIEREKQTLEETLEKQEQYERGKKEMIDRLSESIVTLHKMEEHASRQVEIYSGTRQRFGEFIEELQRINDAEWSDEMLRDELNKAVVLIDAVRKEFVKGQAGVEAAGGPVKLFDESRVQHITPEEDGSTRGFAYWLKIGMAVSLPLVLAIAIAAAVIIAMVR
jgi:hypothetical protein